ATGRLSSADPNLQNIPVREKIGRELRKFFTADAPGRVLLDADYSQIELRLLAELSGDKTMSEAFRSGADIHASTASQVFHVPMEEMTPEIRARAKAVNFGIVYGIGDYSLSVDLGISRKEAANYIETYLATYPDVDRYLKDAVSKAHELGYATTKFGRRRPLPELKAKNKMTVAFGERVAMNSPIQGTAADVIKLAMIRVHKALRDAGIDAKLLLQVHDELIIECATDCKDEATAILRDAMEHAIETYVPLSVEVSSGYTWFDAR
ncbi:MAG: DNA polymerase, partial [Clostridia bacterium]|nr:DNA polymerase [Clostridia bacterium]